MKHLITYKIFETNHLDILSNEDEIRELLGNLIDDGIEVDIEYPHDPNLSDGYDLKVNICAVGTAFKWKDIESEVLRMIDFIKNKYLVLYMMGYGDGQCDDEVLPRYAGFFNNTRFFNTEDFAKACGSRDIIDVEIRLRPKSNFEIRLRPKSNFVKENAFTEMQSIMDDIDSICDDVRDDEFKVDIKPDKDNEIHMKLIGLFRKASIESKKSADPISVTFTKDEFSISEIIDTIDRLVGYMRSENFDCNIHYISLLAARAGGISMRKPISKRISYDELKSYLSNPNDFTFSNEYIRKLKEVKLLFDVDPLHILSQIDARK